MEDILAEARRRAPIEDRPAPKPEPPISMTPTIHQIQAAERWCRAVQLADNRFPTLVGGVTFPPSLLKMQKVARQLHEHKGYYWRKWRQAMRQALRRRRRPPTPTKRQ